MLQIPMNELCELGLEITVWDQDKFTSNDFLGGTRINLGKGILPHFPSSVPDHILSHLLLANSPLIFVDV